MMYIKKIYAITNTENISIVCNIVTRTYIRWINYTSLFPCLWLLQFWFFAGIINHEQMCKLKTKKVKLDIRLMNISYWVSDIRLTFLFIRFFFILCGGTFGTAVTTGLLYHPRMRGEGDCGEISGMKIGRRNRSTRRKPAPAPLCPPQIPHDKTRVWTRAAAVRSQRLTVWAMARPELPTYLQFCKEIKSRLLRNQTDLIYKL
jgi:hypothetical protein